MGNKADAVKQLQNRDVVFVAYSQATKLPYVTCDEESFNDQAWVFSTEEGIKEFGKKKLEDKILLMGMKYEKKDFPRFYGTLYAIGVNTVIWADGDELYRGRPDGYCKTGRFKQVGACQKAFV
ncbi:MAG: hypothetical protein V8Q83_08525 [Blautia sp.]